MITRSWAYPSDPSACLKLLRSWDMSTDGGDLRIDGPARALVLSGVPLREPVAWRGPIVMNSWEELAEAFWELERSTFVKRQAQAEDL